MSLRFVSILSLAIANASVCRSPTMAAPSSARSASGSIRAPARPTRRAIGRDSDEDAASGAESDTRAAKLGDNLTPEMSDFRLPELLSFRSPLTIGSFRRERRACHSPGHRRPAGVQANETVEVRIALSMVLGGGSARFREGQDTVGPLAGLGDRARRRAAQSWLLRRSSCGSRPTTSLRSCIPFAADPGFGVARPIPRSRHL